MTDFTNQLKATLPKFQQGNVSLDEFLTAVGQFLDGFATSIDNIKYYGDYQNIDTTHIGDLAGQFDLTFPRSVSNARQREAIKNAISRFRSNGTERSLKEVFRLIGWKVNLDYCWTLNPSIISQVKFLYNGAITYNSGATYNNFSNVSPVGLYGLIFGKEKVYADGTYADLYDSAGNIYPKIGIYGEKYTVAAENPFALVEKTPYIRIVVTAEDYNIFTADTIDPITHTIYSYDSTETFQITQDIINYFLEQSRPANVALLEIVTPFALADTVTSDLLTILDTSFSASAVNAGALYDGTLCYNIPIDRYVMGEVWGDFQYSTNVMTEYPVTTPVAIIRTYILGTSGTQAYIPTRKSASLNLTVPIDCTVNLYTSASDRIKLATGTASWVLAGTYSNVTNQIITVSDKFAIRINITTPSSTGSVIAVVTEN